MIYLVDANVLSEGTKPNPNIKVVHWLERHHRDLVVDPIVLGEIRFGILVLPAGKRRRSLEQWFAKGVSLLECVPWEAATGLRWAELLADLRTAGHGDVYRIDLTNPRFGIPVVKMFVPGMVHRPLHY